ncbi:unnamed protein product [Paramecium sonneborni]|uniref:Transmembrane protein n=1 Tax=Paramecium sonneborni TaxID=65129 RepID=A0A8S1PWK0_9CILI|nr:unnamed protein product [Paramecium sonneborni]
MHNYSSLTKNQIQRLEEKYYIILADNSKISNSKVQDVIETSTNDPQLDQQWNQDYCNVKNSFTTYQNFFLERFKIVMLGIITTFVLRALIVFNKQDLSKVDIFSLIALISSYSFLIISIKALQLREKKQKQIIKLHNVTSIIALIFIIFCNICMFLSKNQDSQKTLVLSCFLATDVLIYNWTYLEQRYSKRLIKLLMKIKEHL